MCIHNIDKTKNYIKLCPLYKMKYKITFIIYDLITQFKNLKVILLIIKNITLLFF